jgi:PAS domain S-box-containing protein
VVNHDGMITAWDHGAELLTGYPREQALGKNLIDTIVPTRYREAHLAGLQRFRESGVSRLFGKLIALSLRRADGVERPIWLWLATSAEDAVVGVIRERQD